LGPALVAFARSGRPFLGICLGMQMLFEGSEEDPACAGFGLLPGLIRRLASPRSPHIGWAPGPARGADGTPRAETATRGPASADPLFSGLPAFHAYFAHSFALPAAAQFVTAEGDAPPPFAAAVRQGAIRGFQFHPEKSGEIGVLLLARFASDCGALRPLEAAGGEAGAGAGRGGDGEPEGLRRGA